MKKLIYDLIHDESNLNWDVLNVKASDEMYGPNVLPEDGFGMCNAEDVPLYSWQVKAMMWVRACKYIVPLHYYKLISSGLIIRNECLYSFATFCTNV